MTEKELTTLVINKIDSTETFEAMKAANQVNEDELYLIGGDGEVVTGVKGDSETSYRTGKVNITKDNIGLGNVNNTSDTNKPVSTAQQTALDKKVDKVTGKGLSTNDYTAAEKQNVADNTAARHSHSNKDVLDKITGIVTEDNVTSPAHVSDLVDYSGFLAGSQQIINQIPKKTSQLTNDSDYVTATDLEGKVDKETGKGLSSNDYTSGEKSKLAGIAANANNYSLPKAGTSLGGVQSGGDVSIANGLISYGSTMPITKGGTGATTAAQACTNLGALPTAGGTMTGPLKLTKDVHYGVTEPSNPTTGQMFLKEVNVAQLVYPVGAIYMSTVETNPSTLFGFGTWERIQDTFLLAAGSTYSAGSTGGEATHTLTEGEIPAHRHIITYPNAGGPYGDAAIGYPESSGTTKTWMAEMCKTESVGGGTAHNNMPPYLAVYVWKRTA